MLIDVFDNLRDFVYAGGTVLTLILLTTLLLWTLIVERYLYFRWEYPKMAESIQTKWVRKVGPKNWYYKAEMQAVLSQVSMSVRKGVPLIKTLVALCPLLGLLGTVTGMIAVFDVMALSGTGNARMMASGISLATIPTMAGMVGALSGLYFGAQLETMGKRKVEGLAETLNNLEGESHA